MICAISSCRDSVSVRSTVLLVRSGGLQLFASPWPVFFLSPDQSVRSDSTQLNRKTFGFGCDPVFFSCRVIMMSTPIPLSFLLITSVRHLGFSKTWFLYNGSPWTANFPSPYQIWCKNVDRRRNYGQKSKFKMAGCRQSSLQLGCQYILNLAYNKESEIMTSNIYICTGSVLKYPKIWAKVDRWKFCAPDSHATNIRAHYKFCIKLNFSVCN